MRRPRIDYPGARHHVMNRGARREEVFIDQDAMDDFLWLVSHIPERFGVRVHGYALMPNHYHLLLESERGELSRAMRYVGGGFSRRLNARHSWDGPVFRGRFHNVVVACSDHWRHLLAYVHLNPTRAGLDDVAGATRTSHDAYIGREAAPPWLTTDQFRRIFGTREAYLAYVGEVQDGARSAPPGLDLDAIWRSATSSRSVVPAITARAAERLQLGSAELRFVLGADLAALSKLNHGRPNTSFWLAVWWLHRVRGVPFGLLRSATRASYGTLSRACRRIDARIGRDQRVDGWIRQLRRLAMLTARPGGTTTTSDPAA